MPRQNFVHLHCHDEYSILDGFGTVDDMTYTASSMGFDALAQTNHGNMDGFLKFRKSCDRNSIQPIYGCELYYVDDLSVKPGRETRRHLTVLIKNEAGFASLCRILTESHVKGFYKRPRADKNIILDNLDGLVVLTGCASGSLNYKDDLPFVLQLYESLGDDFYLEVMPLPIGKQTAINKFALELNARLGAKIVATNDVHYPTLDDERLHDILLAIQTKSKMSDANRFQFSVNGLYLKTYDEMVESFLSLDDNPFTQEQIERALANTLEVRDKCCYDVQRIETPHLPDAPILRSGDITPQDALMTLAKQGYDRLIDDPDGVYRERMIYELSILINLGFERYFLMVHDLVTRCREKGIMVGPGRGSVGGSLVAYLLGITFVDPLSHGLMFERFISPERNDLPDIDLDFEKERREEAIQYLKDTYGEECVAQVSTFGKMLGRTALRDVARVFDVPLADVNKGANAIPDDAENIRDGHTIEDAFSTFEDGIWFRKKYPEITEIAARFEGRIRQHGMHAAGVVVSDESFHTGKLGYLTTRGRDTVMVNWDKRDLDYFGLVKLDVLGLINLSVLSMCRKLISKRHDIDIVYEKLGLDDKKVLEAFNRGDTSCVFQFGSKGMQKFIPTVGVETFNDLCDINTLFRPASLRGGISDDYIDRKKGKKVVTYAAPEIEKFTKDTYGLIIYQEQVMQLLNALAGLSWATADKIRKVIGDSLGVTAFKEFEEQFVEGCVERSVLNEKSARDLFETVKHHGSYSFNKAHAVAYSMIGYWDMWCKIYYPAEYMAALMSMDNRVDKMPEYIREAKKLDIDIVLPDINVSDVRHWEVKDNNTLVCPIYQIKGVGESALGEIQKAKDELGTIEKQHDFIKAIDKRRCNKRVVDALEACGCFDTCSDVEPGERVETAKDYLPWDIISPFLVYEGLISRLSEFIDIKTVGEIGPGVNYVWGRVVDLELKYGNDGDDTRALAVLEDKEDFTQLYFEHGTTKIYKDIIEHLDNEFVLLKGTTNGHKFIATGIWLLDDIKKGNFGQSWFNLMKTNHSVDRVVRDSISECTACPLHKECRHPTPYNDGAISAMIVGEAPGEEEEKQGKGFVGKAGDILWDVLGGNRSLYHITNVVHCRPVDNRTPTKAEAKTCSGLWLDMELQKKHPWIVLALGNVGRYFFTGEMSGIMNANNTVEWCDKYGCWVVYGIHPAAVLYHEENRALLAKAATTFRRIISECARQ